MQQSARKRRIRIGIILAVLILIGALVIVSINFDSIIPGNEVGQITDTESSVSQMFTKKSVRSQREEFYLRGIADSLDAGTLRVDVGNESFPDVRTVALSDGAMYECVVRYSKMPNGQVIDRARMKMDMGYMATISPGALVPVGGRGRVWFERTIESGDLVEVWYAPTEFDTVRLYRINITRESCN